jgi:DNA-directed RNA polymerase specialized sigma24 family protein
MGVRAVRTARSSNYGIVAALNAEWAGLCEERLDEVQDWAGRHPSLAGCRELTDVLVAVRGDADPVLSALLTESERGSELAGRTVLQAMLGKLVLMAARDRDAEVDDYVAAMWCRLSTYPLRERPGRIAANLALDTLKAVKCERRWCRRAVDVTTLAPDAYLDQLHTAAVHRTSLDHGAAAEVTATGVLRAADQLGLIDGTTRDVLLSVYSEGLSGREAAGRHQTSPGMIRFRCSKAVRRLAQHAALLAEAA